jgi:predicted lipoprotein
MMPNPQRIERRFGIAPIALLGVLALGFVIFPPFRVHPLETAATVSTSPPGAMDVARVAAKFWDERLLSPAAQPVDARILLEALGKDAAAATTQYGRRTGIGGKAIFFIKGEGRVEAVDRGGVWLQAQTTMPTTTRLMIITGPIFGNALRDATGMLSSREFTSLDFNQLGAELNKLAEARAQPDLRAGSRAGATLSFVAAGELDDSSPGTPVLKLVPITVAWK